MLTVVAGVMVRMRVSSSWTSPVNDEHSFIRPCAALLDMHFPRNPALWCK